MGEMLSALLVSAIGSSYVRKNSAFTTLTLQVCVVYNTVENIQE